MFAVRASPVLFATSVDAPFCCRALLTPGFTLGYQYFAPNGAGKKQICIRDCHHSVIPVYAGISSKNANFAIPHFAVRATLPFFAALVDAPFCCHAFPTPDFILGYQHFAPTAQRETAFLS